MVYTGYRIEAERDWKMRLTPNEIKVLSAYVNDDYVNDHGWWSSHAAAWMKDFHQDAGLPGPVFSGVASSLVQKDVISTNGESFSLTPIGIGLVKDVVKPSWPTYETDAEFWAMVLKEFEESGVYSISDFPEEARQVARVKKPEKTA